MEKTSVIRKINFVNGWQGNDETLFYHEIQLENGDKGKLDGNKEESPQWLVVGTEITYTDRKGPRGWLIKVLGTNAGSVPRANNSQNRSSESQEQTKKYGKFNDPSAAMRQQKCISMTTCLDRANELVIGGKIKLDKKQEEAKKDFDFIMLHSGITALEEGKKPEHTNPYTPEPAESSSSAQKELFDDSPLSDFIKESLARCQDAKQLAAFKKTLTPTEVNSKNVKGAIKTRAAELKKRK